MDKRVVLGLVGVVALGAAFRLIDLERHGLGNLFYASAIRSMGLSLHNFAYAAYDPIATLNVDKPPVALWLQVLSTKLFGFNGRAIITPIALFGVATIPLTFFAARRSLGDGWALVAAAILAVFPEAVGTARDSTMDAMLSALLAGGAILLIESVERRPRLLVVWALLMGLAFNVKFLEAFIAMPAAVTYIAFRWRASIRGRMPVLGAALAVGAALSLVWVAFVDLTPADARPYVMNDRSNSELGLVLRYNGIDRVLPGRSPAFEPVPRPGPRTAANLELSGSAFDTGRRGPWRPFIGVSGPLLGATTLLASVGMLFLIWDFRRRRLDPVYVFWVGWALTGLAVFSISARAPVHYIEGTSIALALLAAVGLQRASRLDGHVGRFAAPGLVALVALHYLWAVRGLVAFEREATIAGIAVLALAGVGALATWAGHRLAEPMRLAATLSVLVLPAVVAWWIAFSSPTGYQLTPPNPLANAGRAQMPLNSGLIPIDAVLSLPASPTARYRFAIDGVAEAGEVVAVTGESVLPIWSEFQRDFAIPVSDLEALFEAGEIPYVLLSRRGIDNGLLDETSAFVAERCSLSTEAGVGPLWTLWSCPAP